MTAELKVKSGGSWRTITAPEVKYSGSWRAIKSIEVKSGGVWREVFASGPTVSPSATAIYYNLSGAGTCYAIVRFNSNGIEYKNNLASNTTMGSSRGTWLDTGLNSEVWVQRTINSGSLNYVDAGSGRLQLSTSRDFGVSKSGASGQQAVGITFKFYDAASGGNEIASVTYNITAEKNA